MPPPNVIVTFYENFREEDQSSVGTQFVETYFDPILEQIHTVFRLRIAAAAGTYSLKLLSEFFTIPEGPSTRTTGALAWNASPSAIEAALESISTLATSEETWNWTVTETDTGIFLLDVEAVSAGGAGNVRPEGATPIDINLSGYIRWVWDEIEYNVPLTQGGCAGPDIPEGRVKPGGARAGTVPKEHRIGGGRSDSDKSPEAQSPYRPPRPTTS